MLIPPRSGAENMARDSALMDRARETGEHIFTVYSWSRPTLSLGRNQTAKDRYDPARLESRGIDVVRRPTGGRALLHWREVTYSVAAPAADHEPLTESYAAINRILLEGLRSLGVEVSESRGGARTPFSTAMAGRQGPVVLSLPPDMLPANSTSPDAPYVEITETAPGAAGVAFWRFR